MKEVKAPWKVKYMAMLIPLVDYQKQYGSTDTFNESKGEIIKMNFTESLKNKTAFGVRIVGTKEIDGQTYDMVWSHISNDWFKIVSKVKEKYYGQG